MLNKIKNLGKDELIKGSLILFFMIGLFNLFNYLFHFLMARMLGPADYGIFAVLMSILYIFSFPSEAIQTVITKYTSKFNMKKEYGKIKDLLYKSMEKGILAAFLIFLLLLPVAFFLSSFLKIKFSLFFLANFFIFYVFMIPLVRGIMQGRKKFALLGINMIIESSIKVVLAVIFVLIGWKVYGAIGGLIVGSIFAFIFAFVPIKEVLSSKRESENFSGIYRYSMPFITAIIAITLMYSLDIILAKRFFSPEIAGKYAVLSMLGKMIFFGTSAIGKTMFPLSSEGHENGKDTRKMFVKSIKIALLIIGTALLFYLLFPKLIISILFGSLYTDVYSLLFIVGLSFAFISVSNIIVLYNLSMNRMKKSSFTLLFFVLLQVVLLSIFNSTLLEFSLSFLIVNFLMFIYSLFLIKK